MTLIIVFILLKSGKIKGTLRKVIYLTAIILFGIILGAEPGPMRTVKDTIIMFGEYKTIFLPRLLSISMLIITGALLAASAKEYALRQLWEQY